MLIDTSVIVEIFRNSSTSKRFREIMKLIGNQEVFVSIVQLAEVADWAVKNRVPPRERVDMVKEFARVVPLDEEICLDASAIKHHRRSLGHVEFSLLDAIILASARSIEKVTLTLDTDFAGESDCLVIP